ncbi:DeoR/GlpR family DNA-binding transcription regulator [Lacticaseibacillus nasuensis]|uniref:Lactose transport regulator n=2 Tax=Lacticaseibacillus TaxID=2759736 RepID=A0A0R1JGW2_9LACO|nr:DeoR/GlpR family DNA-binding transcription regulator [Lacticaseibacillus nasuensis]KRK70560.1 lactose transport regulator [Lacticaseibacillus nasuensis JCM 17158]MCX2456523.1 DeoR/GlpR family DNA-binding transcription regulator [Lacticaseibacillus nasuensis]
MAMYREKRFEEIKRLLNTKQELSIEDIMQAVGVSRDTARRDIVALAAAGAGRRTRGGIVSLTFGHTIPSYSMRQKLFSAEKTAMAQTALQLIHPGGVYFVDDSTTLLKLSQSIDDSVTIYTHSLDNAIALSVKTGVTLHLLGGRLNHHARFFFSPASLDTLSRIAFDAAFVGAAAMDAHGVYFAYDEDAQVKTAVAGAARRLVVVTELQKFQLKSTYQGFGLGAIDTLITERPLREPERMWFAPGTEFLVAKQ